MDRARLGQAFQTHFGIRAKFFENRIQNFFGGHTNILFLQIELLCSFRLDQSFIIDVKYEYNTLYRTRFLNCNYEKEFFNSLLTIQLRITLLFLTLETLPKFFK